MVGVLGVSLDTERHVSALLFSHVSWFKTFKFYLLLMLTLVFLFDLRAFDQTGAPESRRGS